MHHEDQTEVLIVGAGPTGLLAALLLKENGVKIKVIEQEPRTAVHSYACALHPQTLRLLAQVGLADDVLQIGRRIDTVAFYDGKNRSATLNLSKLPGEFPFALLLPQDALEDLLEQRLTRDGTVRVDWNQRLADLQLAGTNVVASIDKLGQTASGYAVPTWEWVVEKTLRTRANFVIGADGYNSFVRKSLGLDYERVGDPERFAVYEFETNKPLGNEVRIVLDDTTTNVVWPLTDNRCRWSFQIRAEGGPADFPTKERTPVIIEQPAIDDDIRRDVGKFIQDRAPWFDGGVGEIRWFTDVQFERRLVRRLGRDHRWLVGDAAHQTGPVGMQSMNVGLSEAAELAGKLSKVLRENASLNLLEAYDRNRHYEWERLLQLEDAPRLAGQAGQADSWAKKNCARILPCIPASGDDLTCLAEQLGLNW